MPPDLPPPLILSRRARRHQFAGAMPLSLKCFAGATAHYRIGGRPLAVDDSGWLIVNDGQPYEIEINSAAPIEAFVVFFPPGWAEQVRRALCEAPERLLDDPQAPGEAVRFVETVEAHDPWVSPRLRELQSVHRRNDGRIARGRLEELLRDLLAAMVAAQGEHRQRANRLPAERLSTRRELYRRLCRARDWLVVQGEAGEASSLAETARIACLSPYHLHRSFTAVFGQTPHAFLQRRRLECARRILRNGGGSATEAGFAAGYASYSGFDAAFRKRFGVAPGALRGRPIAG